ncbi:3-deoxy-D-manno-octulosonic acid transferase [Sporohalobacter salinus]|uniref:3-deoxy-D-manno-octulosonic acid transferase n=1 Tax=Sporohalobacter salinus TaxID=1494606 RepID=UPI00195FC249|nr:3-deoxy-D-manno-octulosonic acid transferase [Sporohalobacter salinus]MBM7622947.1 3-deoxy-D-manno-octulosonic-acid transferase [Sporohalobacter salinus]
MIWYLIYNLLLILILLLFTPVLLYKTLIKGRYREGFGERLGFLPSKIRRWQKEDIIWIHAASVGETVAASSLVSELSAEYPECKILFSTITDTGRNMARKSIDQADAIIYFPLDFPWIVNRVLEKIKPELIIMIETELWPNFLKTAKKFDCKTMVASGRISDSSLKSYKYFKPLLKRVLDNIDIFSMQSAQDVDHILELGAKEERVYNNGNIKFDQDYAEGNLELRNELYDKFKLSPKQPIVVMGSTHDDEEKQLIAVYKHLKDEFPELVMILAPRYIKRKEEIETLYQQEGINVVRRTEIEQREQESVILLDTIGELAQIYSIADLVFIGGSLIKRGGHNILEPAAHGKLVFFGPHMFNFKDNTRMVLEHGVGIQVKDADELAEEMLYYLQNQEKLEVKDRQARQMIESNKGAAKRNIELAAKLIGVESYEG